MRKIALALGMVLTSCAVSFAGGVDIHISPPFIVAPAPPPPPVVVIPAPQVVVAPAPPTPVVVLPPPPGIEIIAGPPEYWFWDDHRSMWFYYDVDYRPHYVRRHVFVDDDRHFYPRKGRWEARHEYRDEHRDNGRHGGWYKHRDRHEDRHRDRGRRHDDD